MKVKVLDRVAALRAAMECLGQVDEGDSMAEFLAAMGGADGED